YFPSATPQSIHVNTEKLQAIDSIANDAVAKGAFPGCVVLAAKDGKIIYHKAFGNTSTTSNQPVSINTVYDLASVTKVSATTVSIM
ncbi:serine hydrolase, partial [Enterococcus faecalis]|uniref:serine hydrolase n=1 Tax=Enterococcus faecalis TaxID=1351 RepID=UPI00403F765B